MQAHGAARGGVGIPIPRGGGRLGGLLAVAAVLVIVAAMALVVWVFPFAGGGVGTQDANPKAGAAAGSAIIHDDAGNVR